MRKKLYLETFGCQMNVLDSELVLGQLRAMGYEVVEERDRADVILFNTCSVREHAEQKVWSRLGELREQKKTDPGLVIGVIGCMAERDGTKMFSRFPFVDILCGPGELDKLPGMVRNASVAAAVGEEQERQGDKETRGQGDKEKDEGGRQRDEAAVLGLGTQHSALSSLNLPRRQVALMGSATRRSSTLHAAQDTLEMLDLSRAVSPADEVAQAYVRITRGCNKFCTYCVVPYTRGPEVHRPPQNIIDEVRKLVDVGVIEVTLLGQTINHYCYDHGGGKKTTFADLLYLIHEATPDLPRLRFVTSFPRDFSDLALQAMRDCPRICRYLHVPAQSGNDRILKLMNRGYTAGQYLDFIGRAKSYMPDIYIASDFIVGFPTETDEEFEQSVEMVRQCRFKNSFIFKYSPRPGTIAIERFKDDVPEEVKRRRNNELLGVQGEISAANNRAMIGQVVEVMVEGQTKLVSKREAANGLVQLGGFRPVVEERSMVQMIGRTRGDQVVAFDGNASMRGKLIEVEIVDAKSLTLFGRLA